MRSKIFIAIVATAIGMSSCEWFTTKKQPSEVFNIEGKWKVDSISKGNDSGKISVANSIVYNSKNQNVSPTQFKFTMDSVIANSSEKSDTFSYKIDNKQIAFKSKVDSATSIFSFSPINDSLISLTGLDSSFMTLKRTK